MAVLKHTNPRYMAPAATFTRPAVLRPRGGASFTVLYCLGEATAEGEGSDDDGTARKAISFPQPESVPRATVTCNARTTFRANATIAELTSFPGEDAPGTGLRHFPSGADPEPEDAYPPDGADHEKKSTAECYQEFPFQARASCPLEIPAGPAAGEALSALKDAGPSTGARKRPGLVDDTVISHRQPEEAHSVEDRLAEVASRKSYS